MSETFFKDKDDFIAQYRDSCRKMLGKRYEDLNERDRYFVLASLIAHKARDLRSSAADLKDEKQVYYFSIEFLLGPLLDN